MMRSTSCHSPSLPLTPLTLREVKAVKDVAQSSATESSSAIMKGVTRELSLTIFSQTPCTQSTNSDEGTQFKLNTVLVYIPITKPMTHSSICWPRRYRMRRHVFMRILEAVQAVDPWFQQR